MKLHFCYEGHAWIMGKDGQQGYRIRLSDLAERKKRQKMLLTYAESEKQRVKEVVGGCVQRSRGSEKELWLLCWGGKMLMYGREGKIRKCQKEVGGEKVREGQKGISVLVPSINSPLHSSYRRGVWHTFPAKQPKCFYWSADVVNSKRKWLCSSGKLCFKGTGSEMRVWPLVLRKFHTWPNKHCV